MDAPLVNAEKAPSLRGKGLLSSFVGTKLAVGTGEDEQPIAHQENGLSAWAGDDERAKFFTGVLYSIGRERVDKHTAALVTTAMLPLMGSTQRSCGSAATGGAESRCAGCMVVPVT